MMMLMMIIYNNVIVDYFFSIIFLHVGIRKMREKKTIGKLLMLVAVNVKIFLPPLNSLMNNSTKKKKKNVQQQQDHRPVDRFYGKQTLYDDRSINHRRYQKRRIFKPIIKAYT